MKEKFPKIRNIAAIILFKLVPSLTFAATEPKLLDNLEGRELSDIEILINNATNIVLLFGAAAMIGMVAWGAITWMTSGGNEQRITKGRQILTAALVGLLIILFAKVIIVNFVNLLGGSVK